MMTTYDIRLNSWQEAAAQDTQTEKLIQGQKQGPGRKSVKRYICLDCPPCFLETDSSSTRTIIKWLI